MSQEDLDTIVSEALMHSQTVSPERFWNEFADPEYDPIMRKAIFAIMDKKDISTYKKQIIRLREHKYIVKSEGSYKIRVPIFEMWLREFAMA